MTRVEHISFQSFMEENPYNYIPSGEIAYKPEENGSRLMTYQISENPEIIRKTTMEENDNLTPNSKWAGVWVRDDDDEYKNIATAALGKLCWIDYFKLEYTTKSGDDYKTVNMK